MGSMSASDSKKGTSLESTRGGSDSGDRLSLSAPVSYTHLTLPTTAYV